MKVPSQDGWAVDREELESTTRFHEFRFRVDFFIPLAGYGAELSAQAKGVRILHPEKIRFYSVSFTISPAQLYLGNRIAQFSPNSTDFVAEQKAISY